MEYRSPDRPPIARSQGRVRSLPTQPDIRPIRSAADASGRPVAPAEAVQARLFEDILRAEITQLLNLPPAAREEQRTRIQEVDCLIRALRDRFPHGPKFATPPGRGVHSPGETHPAHVGQLASAVPNGQAATAASCDAGSSA
jgi:hypothetical protein